VVLCLAFQQGREVMGGRSGHCSQPKYKTPKMSMNACIWGFESSGWQLPKHFALQAVSIYTKQRKSRHTICACAPSLVLEIPRG